MIKQAYNKLVMQHPTWSLFQHPLWWDALTSSWDVVRIHYKSSDVYLPYSIEKKWGVRILRNPHLIPYLLPFSTQNWTSDEKSEIAQLLIQQLPKVDVMAIDLSPEYSLSQIPTGIDSRVKRTNYIRLTKKEEVYAKFKPALKRQIRKAERNLIVCEADDIDAFLELHQKTFDKQDQRMQVPESAYRKAWTVIKTLQCGKLFFIEDTHKAKHAALFCVHDSHCAYYLAGGTDAKYYGSGAMSKLMWHAIDYSIDQNINLFDFEGSMLPNINRFFQHFGPQEVSYQHLYFNHSTLYSFHQKIIKGKK